MRYGVLITLLAITVIACDDTTSGTSADMGVGRVPFDGAVMPAPDATVIDDRSFYPVFTSAQWRYRKKTNDWQAPPAVADGAEALTSAGMAEGEFVRRTTLYVDRMIDDAPQVIRQTIDENFVIEPSNMRVGPILKVKGVVIDERLAADDSLVRLTSRTYFPAYTFLADAWRTGSIETRVEEDIHLTEVVTEPGMEEPRENRGMIRLEVLTDPESQVIPMEGRYREDVYEVSVADHFSGTVQRRYWLQQGVGPIQWQFQFANNSTYTLMESNVEGSIETTE
jgi:hypothetical protein